MTGLAVVAGGLMGAGKAIGGASLLVRRADVTGQGEGVMVPGAGLHGRADPGQGFAEEVERLGLGERVANFAEHGEGVQLVSGSLLVASLLLENTPEMLQGAGFTEPVAEFVEDRQGLPVVAGRAFI